MRKRRSQQQIVREIDQKGSRHQSDNRFYGLYRGTCVATDDPHVLRRIRVRIPEFYGEDPRAGLPSRGVPVQELPWAHPCTPPSETNVPSVGDAVWVMFEQGDPARPVWMGVYPTAVRTLRQALVDAVQDFLNLFREGQSEGAIQPPADLPPPPLSELAITKKYANLWDVDARFLWALRLIENGRPGREFGVLGHPRAVDFEGQANVAAETVHRTLNRYRIHMKQEPIGQDGRYKDDFIKYFSWGGPGYGGYAPLGAPNDPGNLNQNHYPNLRDAYAKTEFE